MSITYRKHISESRSAVSFHGLRAIERAVEAQYESGEMLMHALQEALNDLNEAVAGVRAAIAVEEANATTKEVA